LARRGNGPDSTGFVPSPATNEPLHLAGKNKRTSPRERPKPYLGGLRMTRKSSMNIARSGVTRRSLAVGAGAAALLAGTAPFGLARAQGAPLKVGVLLPRSGAQAGIGQDCQRGVDVAAPIFKELGYPELALINADTETNVEVA